MARYNSLNAAVEQAERNMGDITGYYRSLYNYSHYERTGSAYGLERAKELRSLTLERAAEANKAEPYVDAVNEVAKTIYSRLDSIEKLRLGGKKVFWKLLSFEAAITAVSDADGNFSLKLARSGASKFIITAFGSRLVAGDTENYLWYKEVDVALVQKETSILLSNNELVNEDNEELVGVMKPSIQFHHDYINLETKVLKIEVR